MEQKIRKSFLVSLIITSELVAVIFHNYKENTCHRHLLHYQTVLRFQTTVTATFFNTTSIRVMNKHDKSATVKIIAVFFSMLIVEQCSETRILRQKSNHVFRSPYFQKHRSYGGHLFFKMFKI